MRRFAVLIAVLSLLASSVGAAAVLRGAPPPPIPQIPGNWSHIEMNVTFRHQPHTLILDRGRITQAGATQLTLRRPDGTTTTIGLAPTTIIMFGRFKAAPNAVRRGAFAVTMSVDGGAAARVRLSLRP
jgi:hypothetical protein